MRELATRFSGSLVNAVPDECMSLVSVQLEEIQAKRQRKSKNGAMEKAAATMVGIEISQLKKPASIANKLRQIWR